MCYDTQADVQEWEDISTRKNADIQVFVLATLRVAQLEVDLGRSRTLESS